MPVITPATLAPVTAEATASVRQPPRRIDSLTGLRIFAAMLVYLSHVGIPAGAPTVLGTFMASGFSGVTIFFVLSGFVLSLNYFVPLRTPSRASLRRFAVARIARVYPLYLLVLAYALVMLRVRGGDISPWMGHALALQAWNPDVTYAYAVNGPAWSISVEFFLYACFPLVVLGLARLQSVRSLLIVSAVTVAVMIAIAMAFALTGANGEWTEPGSAHRWLYRSPLNRLGDFVLGVVAAQLYLRSWGQRPPGRYAFRAAAWLAPLAGTTIVVLMAVRPLLHTTWSWDVMYAIPAVLLIFGLAIAPQTRISRFLSRPVVVQLGAASYAFYLIHMLLIRELGGGLWTERLSVATVAFELFTFGLILAAALGIHQLLEEPARHWIQRRFGAARLRSGRA